MLVLLYYEFSICREDCWETPGEQENKIIIGIDLGHGFNEHFKVFQPLRLPGVYRRALHIKN